MIEPEIELIESKRPLSLVDQVKDINREILHDFTLKYLINHTYINSKKLALYYLSEVYKLTPTRPNYDKLRLILGNEFSFIISKLVREGKLAGYSRNLHKKIDITKSLCVDTPKIDLDIKPNTSHLVYYQGRFINSKFHDV